MIVFHTTWFWMLVGMLLTPSALFLDRLVRRGTGRHR